MTILCPVAGCSVYMPDGKDQELASHAATLHRRCRCGWVGVNLNSHLSAGGGANRRDPAHAASHAGEAPQSLQETFDLE